MLHIMKRFCLTEDEKTILELRHANCYERKEGDLQKKNIKDGRFNDAQKHAL